ncbi:hypothetical protein LCGC14_1064150 [marine sediment metagenome]|uniref:ATPase n=1 Tax=marine sediment metagenome TaxID=412755 RepID=A0A0F9N744_9ZZZZ
MIFYKKIYSLLTVNDRRAARVQFGLMIIGMVLETLGIGLVIPAIAIMVQGDAITSQPIISEVIDYFGISSQEQLIILAILGLVIVYFIKNIFLAFLTWRQADFTFDIQAKLSQRLFTVYLRRPYVFHLQKNSAELVRNVTSEVAIFTEALTATLVLFSELLVLVGISILLVFIEPLGAFFISIILGSAAWFIYRVTRQRIGEWGKLRQHHDALRIQHLQQGLGGVKDVKLLGREDDFLDEFQKHNSNSARMWKLQTTLQNLPRLMFEMLAVIALAILVLTMLNMGRDINSIVPVLGLFAAAAFRMMPSITRILVSMQALRYRFSAIDTLYEELNSEAIKKTDENVDSVRFMNELTLKNIVYHYPSNKAPVLSNISLTIKKGESVGFIGMSGSGKSTLVDVILGLLTPSSGTVDVDDLNIQKNLRGWQSQIGYVSQSIFLTDDTLRRNVAFGIADNEIDEAAVLRAIQMAQLDELVSSLPAGIETIVGERGILLSGGQRQRIGIARSLYHDPDILVLDEATSSLDNNTEKVVMDSVTALHGKKTVIIVAHRLSTVEHCDQIFRMNAGQILEHGSPSFILK